MGKRERRIMYQGGVEFRIDKEVHPVVSNTIVEAIQDEGKTVLSKIVKPLGRRIERVDVLAKRRKKSRKTGTAILRQKRVVIYAGNIEEVVAVVSKRDGVQKNRARQIIADQEARHEARHMVVNNWPRIWGGEPAIERDALEYAEKKTLKKQGGYIKW